MEFYLDILQAFTTIKENVLGIYTRAKFMLATKVTIVNHCHIIMDSMMVIPVLVDVFRVIHFSYKNIAGRSILYLNWQ